MKLIDILREIEIPKNTWEPLTKAEIEDYRREIFNLVNQAYAGVGGHSNIKSPEDLSDEGDEFQVIDLDPDPDIDAVTIAKERPGGKKMVAIGHDGTPKAKSSVVNRQADLLKTPGYYVEVSGKIKEIFLAKGLTPINDRETVIKALGGKPINWLGDGQGTYTREIGGKRMEKTMFGKPTTLKTH